MKKETSKTVSAFSFMEPLLSDEMLAQGRRAMAAEDLRRSKMTPEERAMIGKVCQETGLPYITGSERQDGC